MDQIDFMISVLKRVKNCNKALDNLKHASRNMLFESKGFDEEKTRYIKHVKNLIDDSIKIIENENE